MDYSAYHWSEKARKYAETLGTIFNVKGRVNTVADLPATGNKIGDVYLVGLTTDTDLSEYAWLSFDNVTRWEKLGSTATSLAFSALTGSPNDNVALKNALDGKYSTSNPDGYISGITSAMVTTALGYTPQQQLVSGTNIKTINGNSLLGSGNISTSDSTKANTSLDNLDSTGQAIIDGKAGLSSNNTFTGSNTFTETIYTNIPMSVQGDQKIMVSNDTVINGNSNAKARLYSTYNYSSSGIGLKTNTGTQVDYFVIFSSSSSFNTVQASTNVKKAITNWGMPNYSAAVSVANNTEYTATSNGFVVYNATSANRPVIQAWVDSFQVMDFAGSDAWFASWGMFPVPKGKAYKIYSSSGFRSCYFVPCIGG